MQTRLRGGTSAKIVAIFALGLALALGMVGNSQQASAGLPAAGPTSKIDRALVADTAVGKTASFIILLADQADVSTAYGMTDQDARGRFVYDTLKAHADATQKGLKAFLQSRGVSFKSYWVANMIVASGNRTLVDALAARSDVGKLEANRALKGIEDPSVLNATPASNSSPNTVEWGVQNINAPQVWALGYTGQGIVIANQDTGMQWDHPAIKPHYRGWNGSTADHNYNWWDSIHSGGGICGPNSQYPCDDNSHGTHTTGTTVGDDGAGNQIGVAPGAKWIGCRNMDQGVGSPATYTECFQFFIAPTDLHGQNPDPTRRPFVMNNSWTCPTSEGCAAGTLETIVNNTQAAGIFVEASAGNSGSGCSTVSDPPALYSASFSTGAINSSNTLAGFSSRGPSLFYTPALLKPNISAPGVNVRSSVPTNSYAAYNGTSMAGPHVVGAVALLWSARPQLSRMITETKTILQNTANPNVVVSPTQTCGGTPSNVIPNNSFGWGRVDVLAAVNSVPPGTPTPTATGTPPTATPTHTATNTPVAAPTNTPGPGTPTAPPVATETPGSGTPTPCAISFTDVPPGSTFYAYVRCLACRGILGGYSDGTFRPGNNVTRGQLAKIVSNSAGFVDPAGAQLYEDVPPTNTFFDFVQRLSHRGVMGGYACGGVGEPCVPPGNLPYFRPNNNATRGQIAKIDVNAAVIALGWTLLNPPNNTFEDVATGSTFFQYVETAVSHGVMGGYACGAPPAGPCVPPANKPYFLPNNNATRGQTAKIVANTFFPACQTPNK